MRRILIVVLAVAGVIGFVLHSQASPRKRLDPGTQQCRILNFYTAGWNSDGAKVWKRSCKVCHYRGNDKGAPFLHSESKTMKGWNRVFFKRWPGCARDGEWDNISQEDLLAVNDFLYMNASDTYDPNDAEDCG